MTDARRARRWRSRITTIALGFGALACATNPVTGKRELALVSEQQEIQMGQQAAQETEQSIGLVPDEALQQYVQGVGARLAAKSQRPGLPWRFRVVDDPTPNAFALPGGFIYVTRGMMNLMNNEAELATVLGHEIGHVTARHSVQQISRSQLAQIGLGVGSILSPRVAQLGNLIGGGLQLLFLKYGRDDEREADQLGFTYALDNNYDVREMANVFASLERLSAAAGQSPVPAWASTHPDPGERVQTAERRVTALQRSLEGTTVNQQQYLARIDGLVYGENPRQGFFRNGTFIHPDQRFTLALPQGWQAQNTPQAVVAVSPNNDAALQLTLAGTESPTQAATRFLSQQGIQAGQTFQTSVNGVPAAGSYFAAQTEQGTIQGLVAFFGYNGSTYQVLGYSPQERFATYDPTFRQVLGSFAPLTDPALLAVQPNRIKVVTLSTGTSLAQLAAQYGTVTADQLAILNQAESTSEVLRAGTRVKVVVRGS